MYAGSPYGVLYYGGAPIFVPVVEPPIVVIPPPAVGGLVGRGRIGRRPRPQVTRPRLHPVEVRIVARQNRHTCDFRVTVGHPAVKPVDPIQFVPLRIVTPTKPVHASISASQSQHRCEMLGTVNNEILDQEMELLGSILAMEDF